MSVSKYQNKRIVVDGIKFQSGAEAYRYKELCLLEKAGGIRNLQLQVNFPLTILGLIVCFYRADFVYKEKDQIVIEDMKGAETQLFQLKWKLLKVLYPTYECRITKARKC